MAFYCIKFLTPKKENMNLNEASAFFKRLEELASQYLNQNQTKFIEGLNELLTMNFENFLKVSDQVKNVQDELQELKSAQEMIERNLKSSH